MALARGLFAGDVLNVLSYRMRPYEVEEGATDRAIAEVKREVREALEQNNSVLRALWRGRKFLEAVELDRLRAKPKVAIIGEFWAMTTRIRRWRERHTDVGELAALHAVGIAT
ncbi:MAG: hypothetical protein JRF48_01780 [Deltaproteobacteria bacterium]|nr:hypothetical protein [Deltaproteobacteria bacterium]